MTWCAAFPSFSFEGVILHVGYKKTALVIIVIAWIALDQFTKGLFGGALPGDSFGDMLGGLVKLVLVHNTGAAWGIFSDNTYVLGAFSVVVVAALLVYFFVNAQSVSWLQTIGIALIAAGGIGNAIDRFTQGYVTDFIAVTFIDFPVFNVADIGVTCGVALLFIGLLAQWRSEGREADR